MTTTTKTLADLKPGDYVAYYIRPGGMPHKRYVTSTGGSIMLEATGPNPAFDIETGRKKPCRAGNQTYITIVTPEIETLWRQKNERDRLRVMVDMLDPETVTEILLKYDH